MDVACTCRPEIKTWSPPSVLLAVILTVSDVAVTEPVTAVMLEPAVKVNVGAAVPNCHPVGGTKTIVLVIPPAAPLISALFPSDIIMVASEV